MNEIKSYKRTLKKNLRCSVSKRNELLTRFDEMVNTLNEDTPVLSKAVLEEAFGSPEDLAKVFCEGLDPIEAKKYRHRKIIKRISFALIIAAFVGFVFYVFGYKQFVNITINDTIIIYESSDEESTDETTDESTEETTEESTVHEE